MKSRVLFVDDEINVLKGLRRMLRGKRDDWIMAFAESGAKALELLEKNPADVVVSDMRMPGMDGAQLLNEVRKRHPGTARIILSGYTSNASVMRTIGPAHQYLAKPCNSEALITTLTSALELRGLLELEGPRNLVSSLKTLPTLPEVYSDLQKELNSAKASVKSVAHIISRDLAMTAQIMKLTNSAFFALPTKVTTANQAVHLLGFETIKTMVLLAGFFSQFQGTEEMGGVLERLSRNSLTLGELAKAIAEKENLGKTDVDMAFCAASLSHVGTLLLLANWPDRFLKAVSLVETEGLSIFEAERRVFGTCHAELGAYLLGLWGFTDPIVEAVAFHHEPRRCPTKKFSILTVLHAAQSITRGDRHIHDMENPPSHVLDLEYLGETGADKRMKAWEKIFDEFKGLEAKESA